MIMRIEHKFSIPLLVVAMGNTVSGIHQGRDILYYLSYVGVFLLFIGIIYKVPKKLASRTQSIMLLALSCMAAILGDPTDLTAASLFCFSLYTAKNTVKTLSLYIGIISFFLMIKFTFLGMTISQVIAFGAGASILVIYYLHFIHPKDNKYVVVVKDDIKIDLEVLEIIALRVQGFDWHQINDILSLNITSERVRRKFSESVRKSGCTNKEEFIFWLTNTGKISPKTVKQSDGLENDDIL